MTRRWSWGAGSRRRAREKLGLRVRFGGWRGECAHHSYRARKPESRLLYFGSRLTEAVGRFFECKIANHDGLKLFNVAGGDATQRRHTETFCSGSCSAERRALFSYRWHTHMHPSMGRTVIETDS
jgi:hypothetical protein